MNNKSGGLFAASAADLSIWENGLTKVIEFPEQPFHPACPKINNLATFN